MNGPVTILHAVHCFLFSEIMEEQNFLDLTTSEDRCVIHFFHADFRRCAIMDTHLEVSNDTGNIWVIISAVVT